MTTKQSPKTRGLALAKIEKLAFQGLLARQREIQGLSQTLQSDHDELLAEIEDRLDIPGALLGDRRNGVPPTHQIDDSSWNVVEVPTGPAQPPEPELEPAPEASQNGTAKIRKHADADALADELGLTFPDGATVKDKIATLDEHLAAAQ